MKNIKNFNLFILENKETPKQGFDWFDVNYLKVSGWKPTDKHNSKFTISKDGKTFFMVFKSDGEKGPGFELLESNDNGMTSIKVMFKKENCWNWFTNWQRQNLKIPVSIPGEEKQTYDELKRIFK